jgi:hypothetical protein
MGFSYVGRKLCCDFCGTPGSVKVRCPFGYCQPTAVCPNCRRTRKDVLSKKYHREAGCEKNHAAFSAKLDKEAKIVRDGGALRIAALGQNNGTCKVWFRTNIGPVAFVMPTEVYNLIPTDEVAALGDYQNIHKGTFQSVIP